MLVVNNQTYYANFKNNTFELFTLQGNPMHSIESSYVINEVGTGVFKESNNNINFQFDSVYQKYQFYSSDSLECIMSTKNSNVGKTFEVSIKTNMLEYNNSYLIVEGYTKEYPFQIKGRRLTTEFPDSVEIKNIFISVMGFGKRQLPFIRHYNNFRYIYYINDSLPQINYIKSETWILPINSRRNGYIKFDSNGYLNKADDKTIDFLKRLSKENMQINRLTKNWFNE